MLPLMNVSPREAYLEQRVRELETENSYLRSLDNAPRYSILREPETLVVPYRVGDKIELPVTASASVEKGPDALHIVVQERAFPEGVRIHYAMSVQELLMAKDRAGILQFLHERTLKEIGHAFFGFNRS